jgi:hypothetical protein
MAGLQYNIWLIESSSVKPEFIQVLLLTGTPQDASYRRFTAEMLYNVDISRNRAQSWPHVCGLSTRKDGWNSDIGYWGSAASTVGLPEVSNCFRLFASKEEGRLPLFMEALAGISSASLSDSG